MGIVLDSYYKDGKYKNYNLDQQGKGMFWAAVVNPNRADEPGATACERCRSGWPTTPPPTILSR